MKTNEQIKERINKIKSAKILNDAMIISWKLFMQDTSTLQESSKRLDVEIKSLEWVLKDK